MRNAKPVSAMILAFCFFSPSRLVFSTFSRDRRGSYWNSNDYSGALLCCGVGSIVFHAIDVTRSFGKCENMEKKNFWVWIRWRTWCVDIDPLALTSPSEGAVQAKHFIREQTFEQGTYIIEVFSNFGLELLRNLLLDIHFALEPALSAFAL